MTYDPFDPFDPLNEPTMHDLFLKFPDEQTANEVLFDEHVHLGDGDIVETAKVPKYTAVDVIGTIYKPTGKVIQTADGEVPEMAPLDGFHANVRHMGEAPELDAYKVDVKTPARMWA